MKCYLFAGVILLVCALSCKSTRADQRGMMDNKYFTLTKATSQDWTAGTPRGGTGTDYYFDVVINTSQSLTFDSLWIDTKSYALFVSKESTGISSEPVSFSKGDKIVVRASVLSNKNHETSSVSPVPFTGAALMRYTIKSKQAHFIVSEIEQLPPRRHQ